MIEWDGQITFLEREKLPKYPGVYGVYKDDSLIYIGSSRNLYLRWKAGTHHTCKYYRGSESNVTLTWLQVEEERLREIERALILDLSPLVNRTLPFVPTPANQSLALEILDNIHYEITPQELTAYRCAMGFSHYALARELCIADTTLLLWESGKQSIRRPTILRLALVALALKQSKT